MLKSNEELSVRQADQSLEELMEPPQWLQDLRAAMAGSMKGEDLQAIMRKQIDKAKDGDVRAARFVFDQANAMIRAGTPRQVSITQNVFQESAAKPSDGLPGSSKKIASMQARAAAQLPLSNDDDETADED